jgi:alcohol dehydrogenase class IV
MRFEFATANRIVFGAGTLNEAGGIAASLCQASLGHKALVLSGTSPEVLQRLVNLVQAEGVTCQVLRVGGEPTLASVEAAVQAALQTGADLVIGIGGGSALDTAKAVAAMATNPGDVLDYLEVVGRGKAITARPLPVLAIPTTAGTGSEVTRNAVVAVPEHKVKASLRSALMLPAVALVDPELTLTLPPSVTASTGMDALAQVIEPYLSIRANPLVDPFCVDGITRAARSLRRAYEVGQDLPSRTDMALTSLFGGLALANAGLGAVHGFAAPIGGYFPAPHGAVCARLLPVVFDVNFRALQQRQPGSPALVRMRNVARLLTGNPAAEAADAVTWLAEMGRAFNILQLSAYGMTAADIPLQIEKAQAASSMKSNPIVLTPEELGEILSRAL